MKRTFIWLGICGFLNLAAVCEPIETKDFPSISHRLDFFEERLNSPDAEIRKHGLYSIVSFHHDPTEEFVRFLKRITQDPDAVIRGIAVGKLHEMFVRIDVHSIPQPIGRHATQGRNITEPDAIEKLFRHINSGGLADGSYYLGLLGDKRALPKLQAIAGKAQHPMAQTAVARGLLDCGDPKSAVGICRSVVKDQNFVYENSIEGTQGTYAYYYVQACRIIINAGEPYRKVGLRCLAEAMKNFEASSNQGSESDLHYARNIFAVSTGEWADTSNQAHRIIKKLDDGPTSHGKTDTAPSP